jgi:hypothetical protein
VSQPTDGRTGRDRIEVDFRRVMASVTEQACNKGLEVDIMEALYPAIPQPPRPSGTRPGPDRTGHAHRHRHKRAVLGVPRGNPLPGKGTSITDLSAVRCTAKANARAGADTAD